MLEILYRIYRVKSEEERKKEIESLTDEDFSYSFSYSGEKNEEILMDCYICETREDFKNYIKDIYGADTKFAASKKYPPKTIYCIIIGEHCWNTEKYFTRLEYECAYCHSKITSFVNNAIYLDNYTIKDKLANNIKEYGNKKFCCFKCQQRYIEQERQKYTDEELAFNEWVARDDFTNKNLAGYIYKITKKSTGEFYIGQTVYAPVWRWGQHLKTERFNIKNILDYKFEVIELVPYGENILDREKYWIQKYYCENPKLSLNISQTHNIDLQEKMILEENELNESSRI